MSCILSSTRVGIKIQDNFRLKIKNHQNHKLCLESRKKKHLVMTNKSEIVLKHYG